MTFADIALARRLERAEGAACQQFAKARRRLEPEGGADWMEYAGAFVVFDGPDSPITQTFGLGISEPLTEKGLDTIEEFFRQRGAPVQHEVSPLAGVSALDLLCARGYRPVEVSSVLYRPVEVQAPTVRGPVRGRVMDPAEVTVWSDISARGWAQEQPDLLDFVREMGAILAAREQTVCFLGEVDGVPGAAGALSLHEGIALFAGAATVPEMRRRGLQGALLEARMQYAADQGCDLAMMVAEAGSNSQRNAERLGFRIAYTRTKWRLSKED
ncbi:MAG: GNAT family N-acetyltransferase [Bryobacteraceae bacterium]|nr:GNAT family N-acetyltransferase [Bryobacteraceae bacterium]